MNQKIAVVTGGNRGIGKEISRQLGKLDDVKVVLTARDEVKGKGAVDELCQDGADVEFQQLDVNDATSITAFVKNLESQYGRCDILVNNAGIFPDAQSAGGSSWPSVLDSKIDVMRKGMETNVYGPMLLSQAIVPLMKKKGYGRIVNMSSGMGQLTHMNGGCPSYRISKTSLNALTKIFAEELGEENIKVNSMCPGWVKTDMGGASATRELSEGADTAVFLATLPDDGPTGIFFRDRKPFEW